jgi:serine/threonine-protein kinase
MKQGFLLQRLKERKLVQWALAYLAGAFVVFQLLDALEGALGLTPTIQRGILVIVGIGFLITLVLAWYHGEQGRQKVSGPELLMVSALLVVAGVALTLLRPQEEAYSPVALQGDDRPAVAVLPCENFSPDPEDAFFARGIHEEILLRLSKISTLRSIGRESVEWYRDHPQPMGQMARELGVGFVGECSVRKDRERNQIRLTFQLLDGETGTHLWAENYDEDLSARGIFEIHGAVARKIASAMSAVLTPEEQAQIEATPTESTEALDLYLRAQDYHRAGGAGGRAQRELYWNRARGLYEQAVETDPTFALAYVDLGRLNLSLYWFGLGGFEASDRARAAIDRALELDPELPEAWRALSSFHQYHRDYQASFEAYREAHRLIPGDDPIPTTPGPSRRESGDYVGDLEGRLSSFDRDPRSAPRAREVGHTLGATRRNEEARRWYERALGISPNIIEAYGRVALASLRLGDLDRAHAVLSEVPDSADWTAILPGFWTEAYSGDFEAARSWLARTGKPQLETAYGPRPVALFEGHLRFWEGDSAGAKAAYGEAIEVMESLGPRTDRPTLGVYLTDIEVAYAGMGERELAVAMMDSAMAYRRELKSKFANPVPWEDVGFLHVLLGQPEDAIDVLEQLMEMEYFEAITTFDLRMDPRWAPLREHPRFQALVEKYAGDEEL